MASQQLEKFQCRRCRHLLFTTENLSADHKIESNCSLWYLNDDDVLPWVLTLIDEVSFYVLLFRVVVCH